MFSTEDHITKFYVLLFGACGVNNCLERIIITFSEIEISVLGPDCDDETIKPKVTCNELSNTLIK
jgi:hypothetical protein